MKIAISEAPPRGGRREWIGLIVLILPTLVLTLDGSALFLALPHLSAELGASSTQQLWITDVYGFMIAGFLITMGNVGDRIGRRKLLLIGAAAFSVASVLAAYSTSAEMLIGARALLGIAGATLMPSTLALISNMFREPAQRSMAIAAWVTCMHGGAALGPVVGGLLLEHFWWGSVFLTGVPIVALLLVAGPVLLPEYRDPNAGRLELTSVALSLGAILPMVYGMKEFAVRGAEAGIAPTLAIILGLAAGVLFLRRQRRLTSPLLDLRLFGNRSFSIALGMMLLGAAAMPGIFLLVSQYVQTVEGLSPSQAGLWLTPAAISIAVGSMLVPVITRWIRPGAAIATGLAISAAGFVLLSQVDRTGELVMVVAGVAIIHFGAGPLYTLGTDLIVGAAPPEKAGSAASLSETGIEFGMALGLAAVGSIGTAIYRSRMAASMPVGLSAEAAQLARESLAGGVTAAGQLPAGPAAELLDAARHAFTAGLSTAAVIGAAVYVALAIIAASLLRHVRG